jgi:hypothetical protein
MCADAFIHCSDLPMIPFLGWKVQSMDSRSSFYSSKLNMAFQTGSQAQARLCTSKSHSCLSLAGAVGSADWQNSPVTRLLAKGNIVAMTILLLWHNKQEIPKKHSRGEKHVE